MRQQKSVLGSAKLTMTAAMPMLSAPQILPLGRTGLLVRFALESSVEALGAAQAFLSEAKAAELPGALRVSSSLASVCVEFDPTCTTREALAEDVRVLLGTRDWAAQAALAPTRRWDIPVAFGGEAGPQLMEAATMAGLSPKRAIADITSTELRVLAIGFAPGQPYLGLLPAHWALPRQTALTPTVPAGAIVVAIQQIVLFSGPSTTGWRQVGLTRFRPFQRERAEPFALRQGDAIRFHAAPELPMTPDGMGGARCEALA